MAQRPAGHPSSRRALRRFLLLAFLILWVMAFQGSRALWEPDEGRYTNIAAQMLRSGDFIRPAFNDEVPHFAKPPLTYWAIAAGVKLLGRNEWGARLANSLAFAGAIMALFALAQAIVPERPWLPPLIYASSVVPFVAASIITTDTLLALWETLAVLGFVLSRREPGTRGRGLLLMWAAFGLAFLAKGPPGLLPLAAIIVFTGAREGRRAVARLFHSGGLAVFVMLGLGWYALVTATNPGLMRYFLRDEVAGRIASGMHRRNAQWYGALLVYVPTLVGGSFPWTLPLLGALRGLPRTLASRSWRREKLERDPWIVFLALWFLLPLAVFFVSRSRLPLYVLPLFAPLALTAGRILHDWRPRRPELLLLSAWLLVLPLLKWGSALYPFPRDNRTVARALAGLTPPPEEVLFLDTAPYWGLGFYLDCEVEQVTTSAPPSGSPSEQLAHELEAYEGRTVIVAPAPRLDEVRRLLEDLGYRASLVAETAAGVALALSRPRAAFSPGASPK